VPYGHGVVLLALPRAPEILWCRYCGEGFLWRYGFGRNQNFCSHDCQLAQRQRERFARRGPRLFQSGPCSVCGQQLSVQMAGAQHAQSGEGWYCSPGCRKHSYNIRQLGMLACLVAGCDGLRQPDHVVCHRCFSAAQRSCAGKTRYLDHNAAQCTVGGHGLCPKQEDSGGLSAYRCRVCSAWHVGHRISPSQTKRVRQVIAVLAESLPPERLHELSRAWDARLSV
jgi:hypothetical protein